MDEEISPDGARAQARPEPNGERAIGSRRMPDGPSRLFQRGCVRVMSNEKATRNGGR
jgi:hypothetical protein